MKRILFIIFVIFTLIGNVAWCQQVPTLHAISSVFSERDMAISPDGTEMMYTIVTGQHVFSSIIILKKGAKGWSAPSIAPFSGQYRDLEPAYSPDGNKIFFSSNRPVEGKSSTDFDIWVVEKINGVWQSNPKNLGAPINTPRDEFYPSVTESGNLYFTAEYEGGVGKEDIFVASLQDGKYTTPAPLDTAVNSKTYEFNAFVSPDEKFILFSSYGRKDDSGGGDMYISLKNDNGTWAPARVLTIVNSSKLDYCPFVTADQKTLYFTSQRHNLKGSQEKPLTYDRYISMLKDVQNGTDNIYTISFDTVLKSVR